jgi:type VI secretion system protein ImpJ
MDINKKVVWAEGVFLGQQHFQQWEQGLQARQNLYDRYFYQQLYGLGELVINQEQLYYGVFQIDKVTALMSDGRWLSYHRDREHQGLKIALSKAEETIYLALASDQRVRGINGYPDISENTAWKADYQQCADQYDDARQIEVMFARQEPMLFTTLPSSAQYSAIAIAKVVNIREQHYQNQPFIPNIIDVSASTALIEQVRMLSNAMKSLINSLNNQQSANTAHSTGQMSYASFLCVLLARYWETLSQFDLGIRSCPKALYGILGCLSSELSALIGTELQQPTEYKYRELNTNFQKLLSHIHNLLEKAKPKANRKLKLTKQTDRCYECYGLEFIVGQNLYLEVDIDKYDDDLIAKLQTAIKIGPTSKIDDIYASAMTAIQIHHCKRLPHDLKNKPHCEYFQIEMHGGFWQQALAENAFSILLPKEYSQYQLDIIVVE